MNRQEKDYTSRGWMGAFVLIALLTGASLIPPQEIGGMELRRANIFSEVLTFEEAEPRQEETPLFDDEAFHIDIEQVAQRIENDTTADSDIRRTYEWELLPADSLRRTEVHAARKSLLETVTPIELYDAESKNPLKQFCDTLLNARRTVRIAFMGDSFVEGDILSADLREELQRQFGGHGTGFAPVASPLTSFRRSIKTQSKGWETYNIMRYKSVPEDCRDDFYVSGWLSKAHADASTRWETTDFRPQLAGCRTARLFFISPEDSRVELQLNDTQLHTADIKGDGSVRQIVVTAPDIRSLSFRVKSGHRGFSGYGAVFEDAGVSVDNYSIRSNNGQAMFRTNPSINAQINTLLSYDLVILQYGLNIMQKGVYNYTAYGRQIEKMVAFVRECFPTAAILILGVSDRSVKGETDFEPMDAIPHMTSCQREAARRAGVAFWPTSTAMRSMGGMAAFVKNGWAGKDYTHINYGGGRRVGMALYDAINSLCRDVERQRERERARQQSIIDSMTTDKIAHRLKPALTPLTTITL